MTNHLHARAFNAVAPALKKVDQQLPLSARKAVAEAVLAELKPELDRLVDYENRIMWDTTCGSCARVLDSSIRETERAEKAEAETEAHRLALSQALGLGTGAPWDAIRGRAGDVDRLQGKVLELDAEIAKLRDLLRVENKRANDAIGREETAEQAALEAQQDRPVVFREAADALGTAYEEGRIPYGGDYVDMCADELRRLADETQQAGAQG
ncbi:hypothetical protein [Streptomyces sp. NPDC055105]|uniref:hypothetical protein n=1 Tax=Streptomyces sp. NPDC055105 TaxID=3365719 RepID=UPI0037CD8CDD